MRWLVIQTRLSVHARLSIANIIKIFIKTPDHWEKRASVSPTNTLLSDLPLKLKSLFFHGFFFCRGAFDVNIPYHKIFLKICWFGNVSTIWWKPIYRFHIRYIHSSFYLIRSIVNVSFATGRNNWCTLLTQSKWLTPK